jgi:hypothetical protein
MRFLRKADGLLTMIIVLQQFDERLQFLRAPREESDLLVIGKNCGVPELLLKFLIFAGECTEFPDHGGDYGAEEGEGEALNALTRSSSLDSARDDKLGAPSPIGWERVG